MTSNKIEAHGIGAMRAVYDRQGRIVAQQSSMISNNLI